MRLGDREIAADAKPYIIAEIGVNHDGSIEHAIDLVNAAKRAGADAIKLQLFEADRLLSRAAKLALYQSNSGASDPFDLLRDLQLRMDQMPAIVSAAHELHLHAIVTVFSETMVDDAATLEWDAFKTASPDLINRPLIESLIKTRKPLLVSTGAATLDEVRDATAWLGNYPHIMMQCVSAYPTPDEFASLGARTHMLSVNPHSLGYSDHTTSVDTGALAVASGARVLEKHLTYDTAACGPDHGASLNPEDFAEYVRLAHRAFAMLGSPKKQVLEIERDVREVSRQSVTAVRALPKGHILQSQDVTVKRPGTGISPARLREFIGRRLNAAIEADMPIHEHQVESQKLKMKLES